MRAWTGSLGQRFYKNEGDRGTKGDIGELIVAEQNFEILPVE